jgi:NTE family protein
MGKRALVVSGGGSKGAFAVGAIEVLRERGLRFDVVAGTSTGALIAPLVAVDDVSLLREIYTTVETCDVMEARGGLDILSGDALFDTRPLWKLINQHLDDARYARLVKSACEVFVCATNLQDGRCYYFNPKCGQDGLPLARDTFARAILASSSQPVLMPAVRVPRDGDQFVDGGVREVAPISKAILEGAEEIYAIVLSPEISARKSAAYRFVGDTLARALDILLEEVVRDDVAAPRLHNELIE